MKDKLLVVIPESRNYNDYWEVSYADSYEEAKKMIVKAEEEGSPYKQLDLSVRDRESFQEFLNWMKWRQKYPISIFGCHDFQWIFLKNKIISQGFSFCD